MAERYRVRRGWGGRCVLQRLIDSPSFLAGQVDSSIRDHHWVDVDYDWAPAELVVVQRVTLPDPPTEDTK